MSAPLLLFFGVLVGYPLIQLMSAIVARPKRRELRRLLQALRSDANYTDRDLSVLDWTASMERPNPILSAFLPVLAPVAVVALSIDILKGKFEPNVEGLERKTAEELHLLQDQLKDLHGNADSKIWFDERFDRAQSLASEIEMIRLPITAMVSGVVLLLLSPIAVIAYGARVLKVSFFEAIFRTSLAAVHAGTQSVLHRP